MPQSRGIHAAVAFLLGATCAGLLESSFVPTSSASFTAATANLPVVRTNQMEASTFLNCESADALRSAEAVKVCAFLVSSLSEVTGIPFTIHSAAPEIDYFDIRCVLDGNPEFVVCWDGCISRTDYRDDGQYSYGAFLFLYAGGTRLLPKGHCHRYLLFEADKDGTAAWSDLGWQIDEHDEWADRELEH